MSLGRSLELFFIDGRPDGMLTAEVFNWTGHVLRIPRTQIKEGLARGETKNTGVYVLLGEQDGTPLAYIGEAENMHDRLKDHVTKKDWWDDAFLISTTGDMLHKAHVKYLESRLVEIARNVGKTNLENEKTPPRSSLSEAGIANMESFLDTLSMVFPAIRVDMFLEKQRPDTPIGLTVDGKAQQFQLKSQKNGVFGNAILSGGEWIVQLGSKGRSCWIGTGNHNPGYSKLHAQLLENGVLEVENGHAIFRKNYAFSSPSAAAAILTGRATNGRTAWRTLDTNITFEEWEKKQVQQTLLEFSAP